MDKPAIARINWKLSYQYTRRFLRANSATLESKHVLVNGRRLVVRREWVQGSPVGSTRYVLRIVATDTPSIRFARSVGFARLNDNMKLGRHAQTLHLASHAFSKSREGGFKLP